MALVRQREVILTTKIPTALHDTNIAPASDPVEAEAVSSAFFNGKHSDSKPETSNDPLYVGSIKTVLGHTEGQVLSKDNYRAFQEFLETLITP